MKITTDAPRQKALIPEGSHLAICYAIIDLGTQKTVYKGQEDFKRKIQYSWEFPTVEKHIFNKETGPQLMAYHEKFTASLHENAKLNAVLSNWRGKSFSKNEVVDLEKFLGQAGYITIEHNNGVRNPELVYDNMKSIIAAPQGEIKEAMSSGLVSIVDYTSISGKTDKRYSTENPLTYFSLDPKEFNPKTFSALPEWMRKVIELSPEFQALADSLGDDMPKGNNSDEVNPDMQDDPDDQPGF